MALATAPAKRKQNNDYSTYTAYEIRSHHLPQWCQYCNLRIQETPTTFWQQCFGQGPEYAESALSSRGGAGGVYRRFFGWLNMQQAHTPQQNTDDQGTTVYSGPVVARVLPKALPAPKETNEVSPLLAKIQDAVQAFEGALHPSAEKVLRLLLSDQNVYIHGPAGSGKSVLAKQTSMLLSKVLGREIAFRDLQVTGPNWSEIDYLVKIMPGQDGQLMSIPSPLVQGATQGNALVFVDEVDLATPEANVGGLNTPLAGRRIYDVLAGETVPMAENFYFLAAGNTDLSGPTPEYNSRCAQDGSFRSRFAASTVQIDYSPELEAKILAPQVANLLQTLRQRVAGKGIPVELSTRLGASMTTLLGKGLFDFQEVLSTWQASLPANIRFQVFGKGV